MTLWVCDSLGQHVEYLLRVCDKLRAELPGVIYITKTTFTEMILFSKINTVNEIIFCLKYLRKIFLLMILK